MRVVPTSFDLVNALKAEGFPVPDDCSQAKLVMGVDDAFIIQFDVMLTAEKLEQLGRALQRIGRDAR